MRKHTFFFLPIFLCLFVHLQAIRYVKVVATGTGDGSSWTNAAGSSSIQAMISADSTAIAGTSLNGEVRFATGKYMLTSTIKLRNGVNLTGGYSADGSIRDLSLYKTILDGNDKIRLLGSIESAAAFTNITTVDGFILQRGNSSYGSAVAMNCGVVLQNSMIRNNAGSDYGAAVFVKKNSTIGSPNVSGALINCIICNNTASKSLTVSTTFNSAAVFVAESSPFSMINCVVANNKCMDANTTAVANYGVGGLYISGSTASMANCQMVNTIFYNNMGSVANDVKAKSTQALPNIYNNWFTDAAVPFVNSINNSVAASVTIPNPGFANPTALVGCQSVSADTTAIYGACWALNASSKLMNAGISKDLLFPYTLVGGTAARLYSSITGDVVGNARVLSSLPDMGAFEYSPLTVTTVNSNTAAGTITPTAQVGDGATATVVATPLPGYGFLNWTNSATAAVLSTNPSYSFTVSANISLTANYVPLSSVSMPTPTYARTGSTITLWWSAPVFQGSVTYRVLQGTTILKSGITGLSTTITGLTANSSYTYSVVAESGTALSLPSSSVAAKTRSTSGTNYELIDDFEGAVAGWSSSSKATCTYGVVNPNKTGINGSAKCAQISLLLNGSQDAGYQKSNERIDVGPNAPFKYLHLKFKRSADIGSLVVSLPSRSDTTQAIKSPNLVVEYSTKMIDGSWVDYVFDLTVASTTNQSHFGFLIKPNNTVSLNYLASDSYVDDIFLSNDVLPLNSNLSTVVITATSSNTTMGSVTGGGNCLKSQLTSVKAVAIGTNHFYNWTENGTEVSTNPNYSFTTTTAKTLIANFKSQSQFLVSSVSNNTSKGTVTAGGTAYNLGAAVALTATVKPGYQFVNWTENDTVVTTNPVYSFMVKSDRRLVANFITPILISAGVNNVVNGTVTGTGTYDQGTSTTLTANAKNGFVFSNWSENGTVVSTSVSYSFVVSTPRTLVANFVAIASDVANYNYGLGNTNIGTGYGFSGQDVLLDAAQSMAAMGTNIMKVTLDLSYGGNSYLDYPDLLKNNSVYKQIFDMSFSRYLCWVSGAKSWNTDSYTEIDRNTDSIQMFNLTKYLLTTYNNTGKSFYLGNWEGDWIFLHLDATSVPTAERTQSFIKWMRTRQNAIDAAKALTPHGSVDVFYYVEVNRCVDAKLNNLPRLINTVIPYTNVDYVSYSSYDFQRYPQLEYNALLDYVESNLPPKPSITGKRVFIGECGRNYNEAGNNGVVHDSLNRAIFIKAFNWGCPFVTYWGFQNFDKDTVTNIVSGWWLITDKNIKTPLYYTYQSFYSKGKQWVTDYKTVHGILPPIAEYQAWAVQQLSSGADMNAIPPNALEKLVVESKEGFKVSVNKSTGKVVVLLASEMMMENAKIGIYDLNGRLLHQQCVNSELMSVDKQFVNGLYIVVVESAKIRMVKKFAVY